MNTDQKWRHLQDCATELKSVTEGYSFLIDRAKARGDTKSQALIERQLAQYEGALFATIKFVNDPLVGTWPKSLEEAAI